MKRIVLLVATTLSIMLALGTSASLLGVDRVLTANGPDLGALLVCAGLMGFGGIAGGGLMSLFSTPDTTT